MHAVRPTASCTLTEGAYPKELEIPFGGSYRECWSEEYTLSIQYEGRQYVRAAWTDGAWQAVGGDPVLTGQLRTGNCPALTMQYFQAAAEVAAAVERCEGNGLRLEQIQECACFSPNPLTGPDLLRLLMDDRGFPLNNAYQVVASCCEDLMAAGVDVEAVYPLQPRTAHVISILRRCSQNVLALQHNSTDPAFRDPVGAVPEGTELCLAVRILSGDVEQAYLHLYGDSFENEIPMKREGDLYRCDFRVPDTAEALWYSFRVETGTSSHWLCPDETGYRGRLYGYQAPGFRLTVYRKDFETPAWFRRSVMYQIFPDRFAISADDVARQGIAYHQGLGQTPELHEHVEEPVRWQPRPFEDDYSPDDFYGGTLNGIREKLPYLKDLGVNCLYLNPIVEARSNHRYDTSDYMQVDPILGSNEDFERLCAEAAAQGIRIILDGVYSHTGADSVYFNRWGHYPDKGACQGPDSPYYGWYDFRSYPDDYRCWWGFRDLPEVDEENPAWQQFVIRGENSVVKTWLRRGASGWRLDVADELPDDVLALIRKASKEEKPDALVLGEVWEDAVIKESYGGRRNYALGYSLDTVMNYPLRTAVLNFMHRNISAYALRDFLIGQQMNYPEPMYYSLMNLMGSHDVERLRTALAANINFEALSREAQMHLYFSPEDLGHASQLEMLCAAIQFALPGVPIIYYGDEQGMCGVRDPFNRMPFKEGHRQLHEYYAALAKMRRSADALSTGKARFLAASGDVLLILRYITDGIDVFGQSAENGVFLAVINRGDTEAAFSVDCSEAGQGQIKGKIDACSAEILVL